MDVLNLESRYAKIQGVDLKFLKKGVKTLNSRTTRTKRCRFWKENLEQISKKNIDKRKGNANIVHKQRVQQQSYGITMKNNATNGKKQEIIQIWKTYKRRVIGTTAGSKVFAAISYQWYIDWCFFRCQMMKVREMNTNHEEREWRSKYLVVKKRLGLYTNMTS